MTLQEIHDRFSDYIHKIKDEGFSMVTNHNYDMVFQDNRVKKFKVATAFNIFKLYKQVAIIFEEFGEEELSNVPYLLNQYLEKEEFKNLKIEVIDPLDTSRIYKGNNLLFNGRIFIECDKIIGEKKELYQHLDQLNLRYHNIPLYVTIRSTQDYKKVDKTKMKKVFLCHDHSDKKVVEKVSRELSRRMFNVWYDKFSIKPGDSIFEKITEGLNQCDNGLLFLSKAFLKNEGWVRYELQSLVNRQVYEKRKVIIPVWLDIDLGDLKDFPWLRDKLAVIYSGDVKAFVHEISGALK